jgi:hypothetical protein
MTLSIGAVRGWCCTNRRLVTCGVLGATLIGLGGVFVLYAFIGIGLLYAWTWYLWARLFRDTLAPEARFCCAMRECRPSRDCPQMCLLKAGYLLVLLIGVMGFLVEQAVVDVEPNTFVVFAQNLLGSCLVMISACWFADIVMFVAIVSSFFAPKRLPPLTDSWFKFRLRLILLLFVVLTATSLHEGYAQPALTELHLPIANLDPCLDGFAVVMVSDVHVGPMIGESGARAMVEQVP